MTDCLHPLAPNDEELLRFALDDEALSAEASRHFEDCPICQQRLATYKNGHNILVTRLYRSECPSGTDLSLYCADLLPEERRISIANHLLDCPLCAAEAADTRRFLADTASDMDFLPSFSPLDILKHARPRIFATLLKQQAQLVVRGDAGLAPWPRQYHADSIDLSLHLSRTSSGEYLLLGIITDPTENIEAFEGTIAELYTAPGGRDEKRSGKPLQREMVDDLGNMVFSAVPAGEYVMIVHLPGRDVVIEGIAIE